MYGRDLRFENKINCSIWSEHVVLHRKAEFSQGPLRFQSSEFLRQHNNIKTEALTHRRRLPSRNTSCPTSVSI